MDSKTRNGVHPENGNPIQGTELETNFRPEQFSQRKKLEREFCEETPFFDNTTANAHATDCIHPRTGILCEIKGDLLRIKEYYNLHKTYAKRYLQINVIHDKRETPHRPGTLYRTVAENPKALFAMKQKQFSYPTVEERESKASTGSDWRIYKGIELLGRTSKLIAQNKFEFGSSSPHSCILKFDVSLLKDIEYKISDITEEFLTKWSEE